MDLGAQKDEAEGGGKDRERTRKRDSSAGGRSAGGRFLRNTAARGGLRATMPLMLSSARPGRRQRQQNDREQSKAGGGGRIADRPPRPISEPSASDGRAECRIADRPPRSTK